MGVGARYRTTDDWRWRRLASGQRIEKGPSISIGDLGGVELDGDAGGDGVSVPRSVQRGVDGVGELLGLVDDDAAGVVDDVATRRRSAHGDGRDTEGLGFEERVRQPLVARWQDEQIRPGHGREGIGHRSRHRHVRVEIELGDPGLERGTIRSVAEDDEREVPATGAELSGSIEQPIETLLVGEPPDADQQWAVVRP